MERRIVIVCCLLFISGYAVGSTVGGELVAPNSGNSDSMGVTGLTVSSSGPACVDKLVEENGGWVHTVASGRYYSVTFNGTITHNRTETVTVNLTDSSSGIYELQITTRRSENTSNKVNSTASHCQLATRITGGGAVPTDIEALRVTLNNNTIEEIRIEQTFPTLRRLPNPISA